MNESTDCQQYLPNDTHVGFDRATNIQTAGINLEITIIKVCIAASYNNNNHLEPATRLWSRPQLIAIIPAHR